MIHIDTKNLKVWLVISSWDMAGKERAKAFLEECEADSWIKLLYSAHNLAMNAALGPPGMDSESVAIREKVRRNFTGFTVRKKQFKLVEIEGPTE